MALGRISGEMLEQNLNLTGNLTFNDDALTITTDGKIGIKNTSPGVELDVTGTARANILTVLGDLSMEWTISMDAQDNLNFAYNGNTLITYNNNGNITGTLATELELLTDVDFTTNTPTTTSGLVLTSDGDSTYSFQQPVVTTQIADLTDVDFTTNTPTTTSGLVLTSDGDSTYSFQQPVGTTQIADLTDVDFTTNTPTTTSGLVLTSDGDSTYSFQKVIGTNQKEFTANGNITSGDIVSLRADGTVEPVSSSISADSFGSAVSLNPSFVINTKYTYDTTNNKYVANGMYVGTSPHLNYIYVGQIDSANNITINGAATTISNCSSAVSTYDSYNNRIVFAYVDNATGDGKYLVGEVNSSNNTITFGSVGTFDTAINFTSDSTALDITYDSYNRKIVICYVDGGSSDYPTAVVGEVNPSTNTLTLGTPTHLTTTSSRISTSTNPSLSMVFDPSRNHIAICYTQDTGSSVGLQYLCIDSFTTNSNNTITLMHTPFAARFINTEVYGIQLLYDPSTTNYLVTYVDYTNNEYPTAVVCTYTSNGIIFNTPVVLATETFNINYVDSNAMNYSSMQSVYSQAANKIIISFDFTTSTKTELIYGTITNNNTFTFDTLYDSTIDDGSFQGWLEDPVSLKLVFSYWDGGSTQQHVYTPKQITTNADSWIGIAAENIADTATGLIDLPGAINRSQTGLTTNSIYYVDSDGSVTTTPTIYGKIGRAYSATELQICGTCT